MDEALLEFVAEAREGIESVDAKLVAFEQNPAEPELLAEVFRLVHSIKGASGFLGLMRLQAVSHAAENVLGAFRDDELEVAGDAVGAVLEAVDAVRGIIDALGSGRGEPDGDDRDLIDRLDAIFENRGEKPEAGDKPPEPEGTADRLTMLQRLGGEAALDCAVEMALPGIIGDPVHANSLAGRDLDEIRSRLLGSLAQAARDRRPPNWTDAVEGLGPAGADLLTGLLRRALLELGGEAAAIEVLLPNPCRTSEPAQAIDLDVGEAVASAMAPQPASGSTREAGGSDPAGQTIRVGVDTLENLMTTVSELVLIRNQLIQGLRDQPDSPFAAPLHRLNQVTSELQEGVMTTRMQPISGAWAKLPRLVRDLAVELGKKIELVLTGQDTELDRQVMELIKDPLNHMIRNAADHGLETPEVRRAAGKSETGRIHLSARHEGGAIIVEMSDDGRGLNVDRIKAKAVSNGLITAAQAAVMDDGEARHLIFAAGFSTADEVTTLSGRGVGMDVVRTNIEKIGGAIELDSTQGRGTQITIRIPLTLSIVSALIVECAGERFALPQSGIVELVSAQASDSGNRIELLNGAPVVRLRETLLPLVSLRDILSLQNSQEPRDACIVVAKVGGFTFGVVVDRVFDTEEIVVKPVATILRSLRVYSGATILGDGAVVMILEFKGMALEAGASHLLSRPDPASEIAIRDDAGVEALLVCRIAGGALRAARLAEVARIEELAADRVESVDGRSVVQYRGRLMPIYDAGGGVADPWTGPPRPLLVFNRSESSLGILVSEIVDIIDARAASDLPASEPGVGGSVIIDGQAAALVDLDHFWGALEGGPKSASAQPFGLAGGPAGAARLLVLDSSPFTQLLVRPLLTQAGYRVEVAPTAEEALSLHDRGEVFDLILTDTNVRNEGARQRVTALMRADRWRGTPLLGLGVQSLASGAVGDLQRDALLADVDGALEPRAA